MKKLFVKTKDVRITLLKGSSFTIKYQQVDKDYFEVKETEAEMQVIQTQKISSSYWRQWLTKAIPEIMIGVPQEITQIDIEADSNQIVIKDIKLDALSAIVQNGLVKACNLEARKLQLKCLNGTVIGKKLSISDTCKLETINGASILEDTLSPVDGYEVYCGNGKMDVFGKTIPDNMRKEGKTMYIVHCLNGKASIRA